MKKVKQMIHRRWDSQTTESTETNLHNELKEKNFQWETLERCDSNRQVIVQLTLPPKKCLLKKMKASISWQAAEAAADGTLGSKGLRNCKYPARARLRNELLQTNQAALS